VLRRLCEGDCAAEAAVQPRRLFGGGGCVVEVAFRRQLCGEGRARFDSVGASASVAELTPAPREIMSMAPCALRALGPGAGSDGPECEAHGEAIGASQGCQPVYKWVSAYVSCI